MESFREKHIKEQINEALQSSERSARDESSCSSQSSCQNSPREKQENLEYNETEQTSSSESVPLEALRENHRKQSLQHIRDLFEKTEAMKEVAKEKNHQMELQFKDLKQKLRSSSEYLLRIKKNIENLKFSYQKNVLELQKKLEPSEHVQLTQPIDNKEDMVKNMEEIRRKIDDLQNRMTVQREKQLNVTETYQEAFNRVVDTLQQIELGSYSSQNLNVTSE